MRWRARLTSLLLVVGISLGILPSPALAQKAPGNGNPGTTGVPAKPRVTTPLLSARRVPNLLRGRIADQHLKAAVGEVLAEAPPATCVEVTDHKRLVYRYNGDTPLEPASTNK